MSRNLLLQLVLLVVGLGTALGYGPYLLWLSRASMDWPVVTGEVVSCELVTVTTGTGTGRRRKFTPAVEYRYTVAGQSFDGDELWIGGRRSGSREWAESLAAELAPGATVDVRHDPDRPDRAVLFEGGSGRAWLTIGFGVVLVGAGLWIRRRPT